VKRSGSLKRRSGLTRGPLKRRRVPKAFAHKRDREHTQRVRGMVCFLRGDMVLPRATLVQITPNDLEVIRDGDTRRWWLHRCWGPIDPAHIGKHRASGADDSLVLPMCRASHTYYDEHRQKFYWVTGFTAADLEKAARELSAAPARKDG
jgi:hypothetical protein